MGWSDLVSLFLGVLGTWFAIVALRQKRPTFVKSLTTFGGLAHPSLGITYDGHSVPNVHAVRIVFWNAGRQEIRREDIPTGEARPRVRLSGNVQMLDVRTKTSHGDSDRKSAGIAASDVPVDFEFLNRGDAVLMEILCTTTDGVRPGVDVIGTIKGASIREGDMSNLSAVDHFFFSVITVPLAISLWVLGHAMLQKEVWSLGDLKLVGGFAVIAALMIVNVKSNILSIPRKLPRKYLSFIREGFN